MRQTNKAKALCLPVYALLIRNSSLQFVTCIYVFFYNPSNASKDLQLYRYMLCDERLVHTECQDVTKQT